METIERAIIMAAGEGRRLRPITERTPKPLIKVNGIRIIDTSIQALKKNDVHEIYIVVGYKKEQFYEVYNDDPEIHILENNDYDKSNNITSLYAAKEYLSQSFIIEGDILIRNPRVYASTIERSMYCCEWMPVVPEWAVQLKQGKLELCSIEGNIENAYRLWGISMWTKEDGQRLAEMVKEEVEIRNNLSLYWDQIPLMTCKDGFSLGTRSVEETDMIEIDTVHELAALDSMYNKYCMK